MNICFYAAGKKSGLSNNGGSRTILRSAETLRNLGHRVDVCARHDSFTWFDHPKVLKDPPVDRDVLIAASAKDVAQMSKLKGKKFWWMRGYETWAMSDIDIKGAIRKQPMISNSTWLKEYCEKNGVKCELCYAGFDFDRWEDRNKRADDLLTVGFQYNERHKSKWYDVVSVMDTYPDVEYIGYGADEEPLVPFEYYMNPTHEEKVDIYSRCHIWLAPSENDSFHCSPAEANLCGCLVVGKKHPRNGMEYLTEETGMLYGKVKDAWAMIRNPDFSRIPKMQKFLKEKIGSREDNMRRFVEILGG